MVPVPDAVDAGQMIVHLAELLGHLLVSLGRGVQHRHQVPDDDSPAVVPLTTCPAIN
jgi:hypothetical protein